MKQNYSSEWKKPRHEIIRESRRSQPIEELERKWNKAKGRHSRQFWCMEWIDLAHARAKVMWETLKPLCEDEEQQKKKE